MQPRSSWLATSALLALTIFVMPVPAHAQRYLPEVDILIPGPDGVLRLDQHDISRSYLDHLQRRQKIRRARAEHRRFTQDVLRPPEEIRRNDPPRAEPAKPEDTRDKLSDEVQRLSSDITRMRGETDALRESVSKLTSETAGLRGEIGALREQLAKRASEPVVTGKLGEPPRPSEPLRKQDSLKGGGADEKFAERPPTTKEGERTPDSRFTDIIARAWSRVREMIGRPGN